MISSDDYRRKLVTLLGFLLLVGCLAPVKSTQFVNLNSSTVFTVNDSLISHSKHFELGIFPYTGGYYLCIRYFPPIEQVVTFMANRNHPVSSLSKLQFYNGVLELNDPDDKQNLTVWITPNGSSAVKAIMSDAGNLQLVDENGTITWDSFKNAIPTDTLLPGQVMSRTQNHNLTSWQKNGNPAIANGSYTFGWTKNILNQNNLNQNIPKENNLKDNFLTLWWTSPEDYIHWKGGPYIPAPDVHDARKIDDVDYVYFHEKLGHLYISSTPANTSILSGGSDYVSATTLKRITITTDGGFRIFQWIIGQNSTTWTAVANWLLSERQDTRSQCTAYGTCGPYGRCISRVDSMLPVQCECPYGFQAINDNDSAQGCILPISSTPRITAANCSDNTITATFATTTDHANLEMLTLEGVDLPWGGDYMNLTGPASENCKEVCMNYCYCSGAVYSPDEQICWLKTGVLYNIGYPTLDLHGANRIAYIRTTEALTFTIPSTVSSKERKKTNLGVIVGPAVAGGVVVVLVVAFILYLYSNGRLKERVCCCELWRTRSPASSGRYPCSESEECGPPT